MAEAVKEMSVSSFELARESLFSRGRSIMKLWKA